MKNKMKNIFIPLLATGLLLTGCNGGETESSSSSVIPSTSEASKEPTITKKLITKVAEGWKTQYEVGDALSLTGLTVSLETYSDDVLSQTDAVTDFTLTIGEKTVQEGYVFVKEDVNDALTLSVHKDTYTSDLSLSVIDKAYSILMEGNENLKVSFFEMKNNARVDLTKGEEKAYAGDTVYLQVQDGTSEGTWSCSLEQIAVKKANGEELESPLTLQKDETDGIYFFEMPEASILFTFSPTNESKYADQEFIGKYKGFDLNGAWSGSSISSSGEVKANGTFSITVEGAVMDAHFDDIAYKLDENGKIALDSETYTSNTISYDSSILRYHVAYSSSTNDTYDIYLLKGAENVKVSALFGSDDKNYVLAQFTSGETTYSFLSIKEKLYCGVEIVGNKDNLLSSTLLTVTYGQETAYFKKSENSHQIEVTVKGPEAGTYTSSDNKSLVLDGFGECSLDGAKGTYVYDSKEQAVTVTISGKETIYALDLEKKSFSPKALANEDPWANEAMTYKGVLNTNFFEDVPMILTFNAGKVTYKEYESGLNNKQYDYTFSDGVVTFSATNYSTSLFTFNFAVSSDNSTLTLKERVNVQGSIYFPKDFKLTKQ